MASPSSRTSGPRADARALLAAPGRGTRGDVVPATALALAVADVNWYSTEHLFRGVRHPAVRSLLLHCSDYLNAWQRRGAPAPSWSGDDAADGPTRTHKAVLPPGWMKRYPRLGMLPLARTVRSWQRRHAAGAPLALVMTYPYYLSLADRLRPDRLVYLNLDDYAQYWPRCAEEVRRLELEAVRRSDLTICVSHVRCHELRAAVPGAAGRILHLPHGAPALALTPAPLDRAEAPPDDIAHCRRPLLGYFGSLEDRIDWPLLDRLAARFPEASLVLIGRPPSLARLRSEDCRRCLARPNVHAIGWRTQEQMRAYNAAFDICLIPYRPDHPFNRVCCPTKIMDYMGTGRPIVSTDLPECRLHRERFHVAGSDEAFLEHVATLLNVGADDGRATLRHAYAREHTCEAVVSGLVDRLLESL